MMRRIFMVSFIWIFLTASSARGAGENPDALYQQGRFAEAEKVYAEKDMDHPKDIRFRYNRGCAAFQRGDFDGAEASFASVLKRTDSDETRFKATFNLGNAAFKKGDFSNAAAYFKQALALKPASEDARVNLELTLREMEKSKGSQKEQPGNEPSKDASRKNEGAKDQGEKNEGDSPQQDEAKEDSPEQKTETPDDPSQQSKEEPKKQDETSPPSQGESPDSPGQSTEPEHQDSAPEPDRDLSGRLEPMDALPQPQEEKPQEGTGRQLDQRKADAFLNNVKEDRARFLQYQMGKQERGGVASGKDW